MTEWIYTKYGDVISTKSRKSINNTALEYKCIEMENIQQGTGKILGYVDISKQKSIKNLFNNGDVLFGKLRPYLKKFARPDFDGACSSEIWVLSSKSKALINDYLYLLVQSSQFQGYANNSTGTKMPRADWSFIAEKDLKLPPLPEQKKIAEILSTWDEAIDSNERLLRTTKQLKSVYVNKIFMGRLFTNIDSKKAFEKLGKHIVEKTDRNKGDNTNDVLSVSNTKGFVLQSDQFEREIASKDKNTYKIVRKGQFAYNPSRVNVGSIDQLLDRNIGIISPMYVVFECKETIESRYLYHFLKSEYFLRIIPRFTQGSVRDSLSFDGLSNMKIHVPSIDKQVKYSDLLDTIDEKIKVLERKNEYLSKQKQGLMQRLLTGKVRVKLD